MAYSYQIYVAVAVAVAVAVVMQRQLMPHHQQVSYLPYRLSCWLQRAEHCSAVATPTAQESFHPKI
jgi:hypothetical protein